MTNDAYARQADWDMPSGRLRARRDHLLREIRSEPHASRRERFEPFRNPRIRNGVIALAGAVILATPALALSGRLDNLFDLGMYGHDDASPAPVVDLSRAARLVGLRLASGKEATLWHAPTTTGGECTFLHYSDPADAAVRPATIDGAGGCSDSPPDETWPTPGQPLSTTFEWDRMPGGRYGILIEGRTDPASEIARIDLHSASGSTSLAFENEHFLGELPPSAASGQLPDGGPYVLVAYDSTGGVAATQDLARLIGSRPK